MTTNRDGDVAKYAELKPKSSADGQLAMSKVYISKNWNLPPRSKPGRRPKSRNDTVEGQSDDEGSTDVEERKKRQNRDAQRAYRERRANKMAELENVVESLQELVRNWQRKYKSVELELNESRKRVASVEKENRDLQQRLREVTESSRVGEPACHDEIRDPDVTLLDPLLQDMIDNFKPMKAVTLKKRRIAVDAQSTASNSHATQVVFDLTSADPGDCGFCSGGTACVCKEIEDGANQTKVGTRCTQDTSTCDKCSDIDESCIKPHSIMEEPLQRTAVSRKRCISAPQTSGSNLCDKGSVSIQASVSLGSAETLTAARNLNSNFCCSACGYKEKTPTSIKYVNMDSGTAMRARKMSKESDLKLLGLDHGEQPNTMDPNFVPGSCGKCQKDPQSKAFCQAIFGPPVSLTSDDKEVSCCGKGSCCKKT